MWPTTSPRSPGGRTPHRGAASRSDSGNDRGVHQHHPRVPPRPGRAAADGASTSSNLSAVVDILMLGNSLEYISVPPAARRVRPPVRPARSVAAGPAAGLLQTERQRWKEGSDATRIAQVRAVLATEGLTTSERTPVIVHADASTIWAWMSLPRPPQPRRRPARRAAGRLRRAAQTTPPLRRATS